MTSVQNCDMMIKNQGGTTQMLLKSVSIIVIVSSIDIIDNADLRCAE